MKPQPSWCVLAAVAAAGALLIGCEGGIEQLAPGASGENELVAAYVDPIRSTPGVNPRSGGDGDLLPVVDGDGQDREWSVAQPLFVYVSGDRAVGGRGLYVELRAIWSDEARLGDRNYIYFLVRYADDSFDIFPDYWRYARPGALGLVPSPEWIDPENGDCSQVAVTGANWFVENEPGGDDQVALLFDMAAADETPASDANGTFPELGCQIACHAGTDAFFGPKAFGAVPNGKLDMWVWRAGRTNPIKSTAYPDLNSVDRNTGRPVSFYPQIDTDNTWPAWMEDLVLTSTGMARDPADPNYVFRKAGYTGHLYTRNMGTDRSADGLPIPSHITEKVIIRREGTGTPGEEEEPEYPPNGGLPALFYLWGASAETFSDCDSAVTSRQIGSSYPNWSQLLTLGNTDAMPGYLLWIPNGSAADVRARGELRTNAAKRFSTWVVEIRRPMITGYDDDVALDPRKEYNFSLAIFDRSSQIHSGSGPLRLRFQPTRYNAPTGDGEVAR
jgi:hypothetical protein